MSDTVFEPQVHPTIEDAAPVAQPAVDLPEPEDTNDRPLSPREEAMLRIAERRKEAIDRELAYGREMAGEPEPTPDAGAEPPEPGEPPFVPAVGAPAEGAPQAPQAPQPAPTPPALIELDVGNQRINVTPEQLRQLARVGAAANQWMASQPRQVAPQSQPPAQRAENVPLLTDDEAKAYHRRIAYGDEADGSKAISELIGSVAKRIQPAAPAFDPGALVGVAEERALQRIRLEQNLTTIGSEYPDIFADHSLSQLAAIKLHELRAEDAATGTQRPDLAAYREACSRVRALLPARQQADGATLQPGAKQTGASSVAPQAAPVAEISQSRIERKRAAPSTPAGVSRAAALPQAPRAPTASELVNQMRIARGQPALA